MSRASAVAGARHPLLEHIVGEIKKPLDEMLIVNTLGDDAQLYEAGLQQDDAPVPRWVTPFICHWAAGNGK